MKSKQHFLSVIVPAYKQAPTIRQDIYSIYDTLEQIRYDYELIVVVDGQESDSTLSELKKINIKKLRILSYQHNHGKGFALRFGMAKSIGDYIAFIDAGMEIDPNGLSMILEHMEWYQADAIVGSKRHPASIVKYPIERKIISNLAYLFSKIFLGLNLRDTQAGLKIFRRPVLEKVLPRLLVKKYAIDLEILSVANYLGYKKIYEAPIKLSYDFTSLTHANTLMIIFRSFLDALAIFYRLKILHFYDDSNKRKWIYNSDLQMRINTGL